MNNFSKNRLKNRYISKGVSLFELLMSVSILSILFALGFTGLSDSNRAQAAKSSAQQVSYAIKKAKYFSRTKGVTTYFNFPVGSDNFSVQASGQEMTDQDNFGALSGTLASDASIVANTCPDLYFDVDGSLIDSTGGAVYSDCSITVGYSDGPQETLVIIGKTGNVEFR